VKDSSVPPVRRRGLVSKWLLENQIGSSHTEIVELEDKVLRKVALITPDDPSYTSVNQAELLDWVSTNSVYSGSK
jgi:hypothetical protein